MKRYLLLTALLLGAALSADARHHNRSQNATPGNFSFYLLSLSWSPAFCLSKPDAPECSGSKRYGFIVHGLWPQYEKGWPQHCRSEASVPDSVVQSVADIMPSSQLARHEWETHGTCSGLEPADYFALLRKAYSSIEIPKVFTAPHESVQQSPPVIATSFMGANPKLPAKSVVVVCGTQGNPRLREVHICLNRDLTARECSPDALHEACTADSVVVPPLR
jgi:ribonuclease T2